MDEIEATVVADELDEAVIPEEEEKQEEIVLATVSEVTSTGVKIQIDPGYAAGDHSLAVIIL